MAPGAIGPGSVVPGSAGREEREMPGPAAGLGGAGTLSASERPAFYPGPVASPREGKEGGDTMPLGRGSVLLQRPVDSRHRERGPQRRRAGVRRAQAGLPRPEMEVAAPGQLTRQQRGKERDPAGGERSRHAAKLRRWNPDRYRTWLLGSIGPSYAASRVTVSIRRVLRDPGRRSKEIQAWPRAAPSCRSWPLL